MPMQRTAELVAFLTLAAGTGFAQPAGASPALRHGPIIIHERHGNNVTSDNWSGYAVTGAKGSVTDVKASWTVPAVTCPSTGDQYASFWVGIDGYSSNTVEQIGTDSDCVNGVPTYYAWYEFYPHPSYTIRSNTLSVRAGDLISAEVSADAKGTFTVTLTNVTAGRRKRHSASARRCLRRTSHRPNGLRKLLIVVAFCRLRISGVFHSEGQTARPWERRPERSDRFRAKALSMRSTWQEQKQPLKAFPSALTDGSSFNVTWVSSGS